MSDPASILIVEDEGFVAQSLELRLVKAGYRIAGISARGEQALVLAEAKRPDLVLMDIHLAGPMDGIETAEQIRQRFQIPVVFLSAHAEPAMIERARALLPYGYLVKPFKVRELHATIQIALARHRADCELAASETRHRLALEAGGLVPWEWGGEQFLAGARLAQLFDMDPEVLNSDWNTFLERVHPDDRTVVDAALHAALEGGAPLCLAFRGVWGDGSVRWFEASALVHAGGAQARVIGILSDITERRERERTCREATTIIEAAGEGIVVCGSDGRIRSVNPAFTASTGFAFEEIVGQPWGMLQARRRGDARWEQIEKEFADAGRWQGEIALRRKDGSVLEALESLTFVIDPETGVRHFIAIIADIGVLRRTQERLRVLAHHDPLTGLPNRLLFQERLEHALARSKRSGQRCAVLFIDLDDFKRVNDTLGHGAGDRLLQNAAGRIAGALRDEDTVARFGGDEFVVLIEGIATVQHVAAVCEKILGTFAPALDIDGHSIAAGASIGVAVFPENGETPERLLEAADTALYRMKASGKGRYCLYHPEMSARIAERVLLADSLRRALGKGDLRLFFQPQVALLDGRVAGFEALVRWQHADLGLLPPARFLALAEDERLIVPLGHWVAQQACAEAQAWAEAGWPARIGINCSASELAAPDCLEGLQAVLAQTGLSPGRLHLELTGSVLHDLTRKSERIAKLRALGIGIALDDFGVGNSSLAALKQLPIVQLKIDHTFVRGIPGDPNDEAIVAGIIDLGHTLGIPVVAKGVETEAQLEFLRARGCDEAQGYLIAKPMPGEKVTEFLANRTSRRKTG